MKNNLCIGLFGTCGGSKWREPFKAKYQELGINSYDPQKENWVKEDAKEEAEHLAKDQVILFPVTSETFAIASLSEMGFNILNAIRLDDRRDFVIMIDESTDEELLARNPDTAKESLRTRSIIKQHILKLNLTNVYVVDTLDELLEVSIDLYKIAEEKEKLYKYSTANRK